MAINTDYQVQNSSSRLRLQFLLQLRWLAIAGQLLAIYIVSQVLGFKFNWVICAGLIAISVWLNIALSMFYSARTRLSPNFAVSLLLYDIVSIAALLYMTGGIQNPFSVLIIAPTIISAAILSLPRTFLIALLTLISLALIAWVHEPLPWFPGESYDTPTAYRIALAASIISALFYISAAAYMLSTEARRMSSALTATETVLAREQQLNALDGLAAAAAHELGTPLGTIYMTTRELLREVPKDGDIAEDLELINSQAERCRDILKKLTRSPGEADALLQSLSLSDLVKEVAEPFQKGEVAIQIVTDPMSNEVEVVTSEPICSRNPGVIYGLGNLIENAIDFAHAKVSITASWSENDVYIVIADDGPGLLPEILDTLGEPFITTRSATSTAIEMSDGSGLGLGFFIAKTLLERSGASLTLANRIIPEHGAVIRIAWTREKFEAKSAAATEPSQSFIERALDSGYHI